MLQTIKYTMSCPESVWLVKKSNKQMLYGLKSSLKFALAGALSTFVPLGVTVHLYRASSSLKGAVSVPRQPSEEKFQGCSVAIAVQYHIQRSKRSATLTWDEGSDLTQSRSWDHQAGCLPSVILHILIFKLFSPSPVAECSCELVVTQCNLEVQSQSCWI